MNNKGQIAIIALFALAIFAVVGGSVVTQIIFEQRKSVLEQKSKEAYYAAESGIENALLKIINENDYSEGDLTVGNAGVNVTTSTSAGGPTYVVPTELFPGQSFFLNLNGYAGNQLGICWNKPNSSLVVMYFYTGGGAKKVYTAALNATGTTNISGTGPQAATQSTDGCGLKGTTYNYTFNLPAGGTPDYLVVWAAYQDAIQVGFAGAGTNDIPSQGTIISSTAAIEENDAQVTREVKYFVSKVSDLDLTYPANFLMVPVYAVGGVSY